MFNLFKKKDVIYYAKRTVVAFRDSSKYFVEADDHLLKGMPGIGPALRSVKIATRFSSNVIPPKVKRPKRTKKGTVFYFLNYIIKD